MTPFLITGFFILFLCLLELKKAEVVVLNAVHGQVGAGNYSYYSLRVPGRAVLTLISSEGDADLYISDEVQNPSFEVHEHRLQSATCGLDVVEVPKHFKRPVYIAVYGHPRSDFSRFSLQTVLKREEDEEIDPFLAQQQNLYVPPETSDNDRQHRYFENGKEDEEEPKEEPVVHSYIWTFLLSVLEILIEIIL